MANNTIYLSASNYNMIRLQDAVKKIAVENGAKLVYMQYKQENMIFYNRSITEKIRKNNDIIEALKRHNKSSEKLENENKELEILFNNSKYETKESKYVWGGISVKFVLDGYLYEFSQDDNVFFPCTTRKIKLNGNSYTGDYYCDSFEDVKPFFTDEIFSINCSNEDILYMAKLLFDFILNSKISTEYVEKTRKRVINIYNGGYHYETVIKRNNKKTVIEFE